MITISPNESFKAGVKLYNHSNARLTYEVTLTFTCGANIISRTVNISLARETSIYTLYMTFAPSGYGYTEWPAGNYDLVSTVKWLGELLDTFVGPSALEITAPGPSVSGGRVYCVCEEEWLSGDYSNKCAESGVRVALKNSSGEMFMVTHSDANGYWNYIGLEMGQQYSAGAYRSWPPDTIEWVDFVMDQSLKSIDLLLHGNCNCKIC